MWRQVKGFTHDGVRFCYKVYAYTDFILNKSENYDAVICIDADSWFFKEIGSGFIKEHISKPGCMMSYLGRGPTYHSEAGFLFFDLNHTHTKNYAEQMKKMYDEDLIYNLKGFTDCHVYDAVRQEFEAEGIPSYDITKDMPKDVFNQAFKGYMTHYKGPDKTNREKYYSKAMRRKMKG